MFRNDLKSVAASIDNLQNFDISTVRHIKSLFIALDFSDNLSTLAFKMTELFQMQNVLGMTNLVSPKQSVIEMGHSLIQRGLVKRSAAYRAPSSGPWN